jgi:SAM-dependent methyltransferase
MHLNGASIEGFLQTAHAIEELVKSSTGVKIEGLTVLDVGCGQQFKLAQYFSYLGNDVTGIDYNVIPVDLKSYLSLLRTNGPLRIVKTLGRKALGFDARFKRDLQRAFPARKPRPIRALQMDAESMSLPDDSFDFIYSRSVFEHLEHPDRVLREVARVLKPGGVAHLGLHLYTCESGAHDPRVLSGHRDAVPLWAHLRPDHTEKVQPNSYLNRLRLQQWRDLFMELLPGAHIHLHQRGRDRLMGEVQVLRGELSDYSDDELLTDEVVAVWRKPPTP